jgi:hypothetical protein
MSGGVEPLSSKQGVASFVDDITDDECPAGVVLIDVGQVLDAHDRVRPRNLTLAGSSSLNGEVAPTAAHR